MGNDCCHLQNLSFLVIPGRLDLAPHYDLLATAVYHTRAFAEDRGLWPAVLLAVRLAPEVARFDQVMPAAVMDTALALGLPASLAQRVCRDVLTRVVNAFDTLHAEHYPHEAGLQVHLRGSGVQVRAETDDALPGDKAQTTRQAKHSQPGAIPASSQVRIPLMADSDSIAIADSVPDDGGHAARVS